MRWVVKAKAAFVDFPNGLLSALGLAILAFSAATLGWNRAFGVCLPGDQLYCAHKLLISASASLLGIDVPFDFARWPAGFVSIARWLGACALLVGSLCCLMRRHQNQINAWLLSFGGSAAFVAISDRLGAQAVSPLRDAVLLLKGAAAESKLTAPRVAEISLRHPWFDSIRRRLARSAPHLILLDIDTNANLRELALAQESRSGGTAPLRTAIIRVENFWRRREVHDDLSTMRPKGLGSLRCIATGSVLAQSLLAQFPPNFVSVCSESGNVSRFWIIGDSDRSLELLLAVMRQSPSRNQARGEFSCFGPRSSRMLAELLHHAPELPGYLGVVARDLPLEYPDAAEQLVGDLECEQSPSTIYIALADIDLAVLWRKRIAEAFRRRLMMPPLVLILPTQFAADDDTAQNFLGLAALADGNRATPETITAALQGNERKDSDQWSLLTFDVQEENRALSEHLACKARDIHCMVATRSIPAKSQPFTPAAEQIDALAVVEHRRWLVSHALMGWRHGIERDDGKRIHPLMVPWEQLPPDARRLNSEFVERSLAQFQHAGRELVPLRWIAVSLHSTDTLLIGRRIAELIGESGHALLLFDVTAAATVPAMDALPAGTLFGLLMPPHCNPADLPGNSSYAPENVQASFRRPWCIIRLFAMDVRQFAVRTGARHVEI